MTVDEQNRIDLERMHQKRGEALRLLEEFKEWHGTHWDKDSIFMFGLTRDILRGTEDEVDWVIKSITVRNNTALMKKLSAEITS